MELSTGASVARLRDLWMLADDRLHVRVAPTASRLTSPDDRGVPLANEHGVCVHYSGRSGIDRGADPILVALSEMFGCSGADAALVAVDSALNKRIITVRELAQLRALLPPGKRRLIDQVDAGAQSGLETLIRLCLRRHRIRFRTQVWIGSVGRVDILVGDRLVVELDGRGFHTGDSFEDDRTRDLELIARGYLVMRVSYSQVMLQSDLVEAVLLQFVRSGAHLWGHRATERTEWPVGAAVPLSKAGHPGR